MIFQAFQFNPFIELLSNFKLVFLIIYETVE